MSKHTPGPWAVRVTERVEFNRETGAREVTARCDIEADDKHVALCVPAINENYLADARLISAASELLEALENALGAFSDRECNCDGEYENGRVVGHACYFHRIEQDLRAAIAKATGGKE